MLCLMFPLISCVTWPSLLASICNLVTRTHSFAQKRKRASQKQLSIWFPILCNKDERVGKMLEVKLFRNTFCEPGTAHCLHDAPAASPPRRAWTAYSKSSKSFLSSTNISSASFNKRSINSVHSTVKLKVNPSTNKNGEPSSKYFDCRSGDLIVHNFKLLTTFFQLTWTSWITRNPVTNQWHLHMSYNAEAAM